MVMTDDALHRAVVATLRDRGYVITNIDGSGVTGVDPNDKLISLTWREVEELTVSLLISPSIASVADEDRLRADCNGTNGNDAL